LEDVFRGGAVAVKYKVLGLLACLLLVCGFSLINSSSWLGEQNDSKRQLNENITEGKKTETYKQDVLEPEPKAVKEDLPGLESPLNILVIGIDRATSINGPPRPKPWRADVIILVRVDPGKNKAFVLSIPRDTRVEIPGRGMEKIAHAHSYGEIPLTVNTVEGLIGIEVDHYIQVDYATFARMVDIMGGIEIDVQKELKTKHFKFVPGTQLLDGKQAYEYVTNRDEPMADIARIDRQQHFLCELLENIKDQAGVLDLTKMYLEFRKSAETSLDLGDTVKLALFARKLKQDDLIMQKLPGRPEYIEGLSYWIVDEGFIKDFNFNEQK